MEKVTAAPDRLKWPADFIAMLKGQKTRSDAHELLVLLHDNPQRTKEEERTYTVLLRAERAKRAAKAAEIASASIMNAKAEASRKERNHRLIQQGLLIDFAGLDGLDPAELLGGLLALAKTPERTGWKAHGQVLLNAKQAKTAKA